MIKWMQKYFFLSKGIDLDFLAKELCIWSCTSGSISRLMVYYLIVICAIWSLFFLGITNENIYSHMSNCDFTVWYEPPWRKLGNKEQDLACTSMLDKLLLDTMMDERYTEDGWRDG